MWKVVNDVLKPGKSSEWRLNLDNEITEDEEIIANAFNDFFIEKIVTLKEGINKNDIKDPLVKLKEIFPSI